MAKICRIKSEEARQVCFSKRWAGLIKMARELAILCGMEVAAVTISPAGKALSFGHPSVEAILERFAPTGAGGGGGGAGTGEDNRPLEELIREYRELRALLATEKVRKERLEAAMAKERTAGNPMAVWLEADVRDLGEKELEAYAAALDALNCAMVARARSSNDNNQVQVQPPPQEQFLANDSADAAEFVDQFGAGSSSSANNNNADMAMPPPTGFACRHGDDAAAEFGFPGPN